ncbi:MAG: sugar transferase [Candidatus Paceibacterota bacterium]
MTKRIFDIIFSLFGIVITFPIWILAVFLIKKDSSGPIFYIAKRIGKGGVPFRMYKFRTMVNNADKIGGPSTAGDDIRLTKTGKFLKRFQIDELPQLINILKGDMSFVGPRPEVKMYVDI